MIIYMIIMGMMTSYWDDLIGMFFFYQWGIIIRFKGMMIMGIWCEYSGNDYFAEMITLRKLRLYLAKMVYMFPLSENMIEYDNI